MSHMSLSELVKNVSTLLPKDPIALVFVEDNVEVDSTLRHLQGLGFKRVVGFMPDAQELAEDLAESTLRVTYDIASDDRVETAINALTKAAPDLWFFYCYNAEYLFFPFCETRNIAEMLTFHREERRWSMLSYVIDLYAGHLDESSNPVSVDDAHMDRSGYYASSRLDPNNHNHPKDRQLNFYGGLKWRFEEHIPITRQRIDRISIFRRHVDDDLVMDRDQLFNIEEYNTYACEWHNNLTACVMSFRTAKALKRNPGSTHEIPNFKWSNSVKFNWHSQQLLELGLMETGQWF